MARERKHMQKIWRNLSSDLQELVLRHLPVSTLYKFRAVCKRWNYLLTLPEFRSSCYHPLTEAPHLLCIPKNPYLENCPVLNPIASWGCMDLTFLNPALNGLCCNRIGKIATDSSLLCVQANYDDYICNDLIVCNPLTKQWDVLPKNSLVEDWPIKPVDDQDELVSGVLAMQVHKDDTFQICTIGAKYWPQEGSRLQMYDSRSRSWKLLDDTGGFTLLSGVFFNTLLYCVCLEEVTERLCLLTYDVGQEKWQEVDMDLNVRLKWERIVVVGDHLYLLGLKKKKVCGVYVISSIRIYDFDILKSKSSQIAHMPKTCVDVLFPRKNRRYEEISWTARGHGNTIVFLTSFGNPVVYDMHQGKAWGLLPSLGDNWADEMCLSSITFSLVATVAGASSE